MCFSAEIILHPNIFELSQNYLVDAITRRLNTELFLKEFPLYELSDQTSGMKITVYTFLSIRLIPFHIFLCSRCTMSIFPNGQHSREG